MTELFSTSVIANGILIGVLAGSAWFVGRGGRRSELAHLLWIVVLLKCITPTFVDLPLLPAVTPAVDVAIADEPLGIALDESVAATQIVDEAGSESLVKQLLLAAWALGSSVILVVGGMRLMRFERTLRSSLVEVSDAVRALATDRARRIGLRQVPTISVTTASVAPFVSGFGRSVRVVLPQQLVDEMGSDELGLVLAHEFAHVARRDHMVRWIEWAVVVAVWWNPIVWWARRELRVAEEHCCDALVIERLRPKPRKYARSLLSAAEVLVSPVLRPPVVASSITDGDLEQRILHIMSNRTSRLSRALRSAAVACAALLLPMGVVHAQDFEAIQKRLDAAVAAGELDAEGAAAMMEALKRDSESRKTKLEYAKLQAEMDAGVEAGKFTREEADEKLAAARIKLFPVRSERSPEDIDDRMKRGRYAKYAEDIERKVTAGELTREKADALLEETRKEIFGPEKKSRGRTETDGDTGTETDKDDQRALRARYAKFAEGIERKVAAGEITREKADALLEEKREEMFGDGR